MFGRKEETPQNQSIQVLNSIAVGTIIEGNVRTEGDLRVDGKVVGNIICKGRLVSGPSSEILGDILCVNGNLEGMCRGNIQVNEVLKVAKSANIDGIISTKKLTVDEGAVVQAKINMSNGSGNSGVSQKTNIPPHNNPHNKH